MKVNKIPFAERRKRMKLGIPSDNSYAMLLVKKSANIPIEDFFNQQPERLKQLENMMKKCGNNRIYHTYQDVAAIIYELFMNDTSKEYGMEMMMFLAEPYLKEYRSRKKAINEKNIKR